MDRNEFISTLREALQGNISGVLVEEHINYYQSYISQEIAAGSSERQVLEQLGAPRLIAKSIIAASGGQRNSHVEWTYTEDEEKPRRGFYAQENETGGVDIHYRKFHLNTWYGKLLVIAVVVLVLYLVFTIVGGILSLILPVALPVLLIVCVIRLFSRRS